MNPTSLSGAGHVVVMMMVAAAALACGQVSSPGGKDTDVLEPAGSSTPSAPDATDSELEISQVVYVRRGPTTVVLLAGARGRVHIDPECIVLEVFEDNSSEFYTLMFDYREPVLVSSPTGPITYQYPPAVVLEGKHPDRVASVRPVTIDDGEVVEFAAPNRWRREHLSDETVALVTEPHESCPEEFWFPGQMVPVGVVEEPTG